MSWSIWSAHLSQQQLKGQAKAAGPRRRFLRSRLCFASLPLRLLDPDIVLMPCLLRPPCSLFLGCTCAGPHHRPPRPHTHYRGGPAALACGRPAGAGALTSSRRLCASAVTSSLPVCKCCDQLLPPVREGDPGEKDGQACARCDSAS